MSVRHLLVVASLALPIGLTAHAQERASLLARAGGDAQVAFDVFVRPPRAPSWTGCWPSRSRPDRRIITAS